MSEANVEIAKGVIDAFNRRDYEKALHGFHADAVWHNTAESPDSASASARRPSLTFGKTLMESFEERGSRMDVERVVEGEDTVVLGVHSVGEGKASGVPLDVHWGAAFRVRDGKISRVDVHGDWAKALQAAGLAG